MEQNKNNSFGWILRFAAQCRGKLAASVLLAVLGAACGVVPYLAVSKIIIQLLAKNYELSSIALMALVALLGYLGSTWLNTASTMLSHRLGFYNLEEYPHRTDGEALPCTHGLYLGYAFGQV